MRPQRSHFLRLAKELFSRHRWLAVQTPLLDLISILAAGLSTWLLSSVFRNGAGEDGLLLAGMAAGAFAVSIGTQFLAFTSTTRLWREFEAAASIKVMERLAEMPAKAALRLPFAMTRANAIQLIQKDVRMAALACRQIAQIPSSLLMLIAAVAATVWLDPLLPLFPLTAVALAMPVLYMVNRKAVRLSERFEADASAMAQEKAEWLDRQTNEAAAPKSIRLPSTERLLNTFADRTNLIAESSAIVMMAGTVSLIGSLFYLSREPQAAGSYGAGMLIILMAGRYLAGAFQVLSRSAVILNRSRSPISRYLGLFDDGSAHLENSQNIEVKLTIAADNQTSAMLKAGDVAIIVGPVPLSRFAAFECLESLKTSALDSLPLLTTAQIFAVRTPADAFSNARRTDRVAFIDMQTATAVEATDSGCAQLIPDGRITFVWCARVLPREAPLCGATHVLVFNKGTFQAVYQTGEVRKNGALLRAHFDRRQQSGTSVDNNDLISDNIADLALMD